MEEIVTSLLIMEGFEQDILSSINQITPRIMASSVRDLLINPMLLCTREMEVAEIAIFLILTEDFQMLPSTIKRSGKHLEMDFGRADIRSGKFSKSFYGNLNHYSLDESKMKDTLTRNNLTGKPNNEGKKEAIQNAYLPFSRTRQKSSVEELMRVNHHSLDTLDDTKRNTIHSELSYGSRNRYAAPGLLKNKKNISKSQQKMYLSQEHNQAQRRSPKEVSCRSKNLMPTMKLKHLSNLPNSSMKNGNMKVKDVISKEVGSKLLKSKALSSIQLKKWKNFLKEKKRVKNNL
ncbi:unnamed protein product [Moneuplotes crassus]|uniref:Uncharacterized protein n=1 Tax=Euplotes crassus TaxID=5936 RepID=A0AAD1XLA6_EUPCR|nr:unnamed protein product [Moneuplotes crassus]